MKKEELIEKAKNEQVDFNGNVFVNGNWNGVRFERLFVQYADKEGIHACKRGYEKFLDYIAPFDFDEIGDEVYERLIKDIVE